MAIAFPHFDTTTGKPVYSTVSGKPSIDCAGVNCNDCGCPTGWNVVISMTSTCSNDDIGFPCIDMSGSYSINPSSTSPCIYVGSFFTWNYIQILCNGNGTFGIVGYSTSMTHTCYIGDGVGIPHIFQLGCADSRPTGTVSIPIIDGHSNLPCGTAVMSFS